MTSPSGTPAISINRAPDNFNFADLSTTPGGTIYATTPGGTRIVYDRSALLFLRNSPLAKTPPNNIAFIPGVTGPDVSPKDKTKQEKVKQPKETKDDADEMFKMD